MTRSLPFVVVFVVLASVSTLAHHGYPDFLLNQRVTVDGTLEELHYANPHVVLKIRTTDRVLYTAEWQAASWLLLKAHVMLTTLRVGDHLTVIGAPSRDPAAHEVVRLNEVRRASDGWTYKVIESN